MPVTSSFSPWHRAAESATDFLEHAGGHPRHFQQRHHVLLAWVIKSAVLRYGGPRLFMQLRPFFLGLILGEFVPRGLLAMIEVAGGLP